MIKMGNAQQRTFYGENSIAKLLILKWDEYYKNNCRIDLYVLSWLNILKLLTYRLFLCFYLSKLTTCYSCKTFFYVYILWQTVSLDEKKPTAHVLEILQNCFICIFIWYISLWMLGNEVCHLIFKQFWFLFFSPHYYICYEWTVTVTTLFRIINIKRF